MSRHVYFGLACEGATDQATLPHFVDKAVLELHRSDRLRVPFTWDTIYAEPSSAAGIAKAVASREYDIVLAHRDGGGDGSAARRALQAASAVPVVPVREMEAWLLADVDALSAEFGDLPAEVLQALPSPAQVEGILDPKAIVNRAIEAGFGRPPRPRSDELEAVLGSIAARANVDRLLQVRWFATFVADLGHALRGLGWPFASTGP